MKYIHRYITFRFQWRPVSPGLKGSAHCCEQAGLSQTHVHCSRSDAGFWFWRLHFPLPHASKQEPHVLSLSEGKYICHSYCRDLVHLDYPPNGKLPSRVSACEVRRSSEKHTQVGAVGWRSGFRSTISHTPDDGLFTPVASLSVSTGST